MSSRLFQLAAAARRKARAGRVLPEVSAEPVVLSWLRSDIGVDAQRGTRAHDLTRQGYNFSNGTASQAPTIVQNVTEGEPGLLFDGTNDILLNGVFGGGNNLAGDLCGGSDKAFTLFFAINVLTAPADPENHDLFVAINSSNQSTGLFRFGYTDSNWYLFKRGSNVSTGNLFGGSGISTGLHFVTLIHTGTSTTVRLDGVTDYTVSMDVAAMTGLDLCGIGRFSGGGNASHMHLLEFIAADGALSTDDIEEIESYFAGRYIEIPSAPGEYSMTAESRSYALVAPAATLTYDPGDQALTAESRTFTLTGTAATLTASAAESSWTDISAISTGGTTYYVSSSTGSDSNNGLSPSTPKATIEATIIAMAGGDRLLLKRGDTWNCTNSNGINNNRWKNGTDAAHYTVFGTYGDEADGRATILCTTLSASGFIVRGGGSSLSSIQYVAIIGWHFTSSARNPNHANWNSGAASSSGHGIQVLRGGTNLWIEDCVFEFFGVNTQIQGDNSVPLVSPTLFRCQIRDCWFGEADGHSNGTYAAHLATSLVIKECVYDHNGWCEHVSTPTGVATIYNHNIYIQRDVNPTGLEVVDNIIARASSNGYQLRAGGKANRNILLNNAIAGFVANDYDTSLGGPHTNFVMEQNDNVVCDARLTTNTLPRGWGLAIEAPRDPDVSTPDHVHFKRNFLLHTGNNSNSTNGERALPVDAAFNATIEKEDNVVYEWANVADDPPGVTYVDPTRTIEAYAASLGLAPTLAAFMAECRQQRRGYWREEYTAQAVRAYFVAGYTPV